MKITRILTTVTLCFAFAGLSFGQGISGTGHDLPFNSYSTPNSEICVVCHTPHNAISTEGPLWNHTANATTGFTMYSSTTLDATIATNPQGESLLCLSCHDGTVGVDAIGGNTTLNYVTGVANFGKDLSDHHPISITYNTALLTDDAELFDPSSTASGLGGATDYIDADMLFGTSNDQLECASCHDVHNSAGVSNLLIKTNTGSALCLTCHNK